MTAWPKVPIGEVMSGFFDGPHATPPPAEDGPIYLGIKNVTEDGRLDLSEIRHIAWEDFAHWTRRVEPQPGDLVFTYEASLHRYAMIPLGFKGCLGRRTALIRPDKSKVDGRFLLYQLLGPKWRATVAQRINIGSTVDRIPLTDFPDFPIHLPPLPVQRKIASVLAAYDELIEKNARRIQILEDMAQALYREWFVEYRFPGHEDVELVDSELGAIPMGWHVSTFGDAFQVVGGATPSTKCPEYWDGGTINWYTPSDLTRHGHMFIDKSSRRITQAGLDACSATLFPAGSVMMTSRATLGVLAINTEPACTNQGFITVLPNERLPAAFIYFLLASKAAEIEALASGATFKEISKRSFRTIRFALPPVDLVTRFTKLTDPMLGLIRNLIRQNANLRATRDLLLPRLVSGEIDVSNLDIDTEWLVA